MASSATDIVTTDEIKQQLRLGGDTTETRAAFDEQDDLLDGYIATSVSFVAKHISLPLLDVQETGWCAPVIGEYPLHLSERAIKRVNSVAYWSADGALRDDPDGTIAATDLGRAEYVGGDDNFVVYPPADGWPATLTGSLFKVGMTRGLDIDDSSRALKDAVVIGVRQLYDGYREIKPTNALFMLIRPWRRYG